MTVGGKAGAYEKVQTTAGAVSLLFFQANGTQFMLRDADGGAAGDLAAVAGSVVNASQQITPAIVAGAPSLVGGKVRVPVSTAGSGFARYSGFSIHLRWSGAVFSFASANSTGTVIPSPFCPAAVADSDGAGVTYACTATAGDIATAGLLATIVLTPAASGCSPLHLFTFGAPDGGIATNGTYTIDAASNAPQTTHYVDGSANVAGRVC